MGVACISCVTKAKAEDAMQDVFAKALENLVRFRNEASPLTSGRGEIKVTSGLAAGLVGIDCWGPSTVPTYVSRDWDKAANQGDMATCVLPPLR